MTNAGPLGVNPHIPKSLVISPAKSGVVGTAPVQVVRSEPKFPESAPTIPLSPDYHRKHRKSKDNSISPQTSPERAETTAVSPQSPSKSRNNGNYEKTETRNKDTTQGRNPPTHLLLRHSSLLPVVYNKRCLFLPHSVYYLVGLLVLKSKKQLLIYSKVSTLNDLLDR